MSQRLVIRFHQDTRSVLDTIAAEKGWKTPHLVTKIIEESVPSLDISSYRVIKDEYRNLKKGIRGPKATKQMSVWLSEDTLQAVNEIAENHRDRIVFPTTVVRDITIRWLEKNSKID